MTWIVEAIGRGRLLPPHGRLVITSLVSTPIAQWARRSRSSLVPRACSGEGLGSRADRARHRLDARQPPHPGDEDRRRLSISGEDVISLGNVAEGALIFAQTDPEKAQGPPPPCPTDLPASPAPNHGKLGLRASDTAELSLDAVDSATEALSASRDGSRWR